MASRLGIWRKFSVAIVFVLAASLFLASSAMAATTRYDATSSNIVFTPSPWSISTPGIPHFGGSVFFSSTLNATASFAFSGTEVSWVAAKWYNRGQAAVSVDGGPETTVDLYSAGTGDLSTVLTQQVVYTSSGLSDGPHTLTIRVLGTKQTASSDYLITIDAFDVTLPDPPPVVSSSASSLWSIALGVVIAVGLVGITLRKRLVKA